MRNIMGLMIETLVEQRLINERGRGLVRNMRRVLTQSWARVPRRHRQEGYSLVDHEGDVLVRG